MLELTAMILVVSAVLVTVAIATFSWSVAGSKVLLTCSIAVGAVGVLLAGLGAADGGVAAWAFLFACGGCSCGLTAWRNLTARPTRWIHRFVIYAGYAATFAAMGVAGLWLESSGQSGRLAAFVFLAVYIIGSACIFGAKSLTLRLAARNKPEYHASLAGVRRGQGGDGYW